MSTSRYCNRRYFRQFDQRFLEENEFDLHGLAYGTAPKRAALRARICVAFHGCGSVFRTASALKTTIKTVERTLDRFVRYGLAGLKTPSLPHGRSTRRLPDVVRRKLMALIGPGKKKHGAMTPRHSTRSLAAKLGISAMSVSRTLREYGYDKRSLRRKRSDLASNTWYIVGFSVQKALVFGVLKSESIQPAAIGNLPEQLRLSLDRRFGEQLQQFDNSYSPPRRGCKDFVRFMHQVDAKAHPDMALYVICRKALKDYLPALKRTPPAVRQLEVDTIQSSPTCESQGRMKPSASVKMPKIHFHFCPGHNWSYLILQHLAYARQHQLTIKNWHAVAHCMEH